MRTDLDHLPPRKQRDLERVVRILFEEFEQIIGRATQDWKKRGRILKLILYGSHARGDWVEDRASGYSSDYDILVVVNDARLTDPIDYWSNANDRLLDEELITKRIGAPVNFIVHDLADVNDQLSCGRPFFADIIRDGVALYEAGGFPLARPRKLPPEEARAEAQRYFDEWLPSADRFLASTNFFIQREGYKEAAFVLHQATERLYHCLLLVLTLYSPKLHNIGRLRSLAEDRESRLIEAWPRATRKDRARFEKLRDAYVKARYSPHYTISGEELAWLSEHVAVLQALVKRACEERLAGG